MEFIGGSLYVAWSDNKLYRFSAPGGLPRWGTRTVVDNGDTSGIPWSRGQGPLGRRRQRLAARFRFRQRLRTVFCDQIC